MEAKRIGRYELRGQLGRGGMATVYRAYDTHFRRSVAIKLLPPQFLHDPRFRSRFKREAMAVASLEHPAIVPVYDYGEDDDQLFLVMRLMGGGSLANRIQQAPLSLEEAFRILRRIAPALDFAHQQGIVHRDLKPDNILFDRHNEPYLTDFGIVKLLEGNSMVVTATVGLIGTPAFMSPEQALADITLDGRSDIYSLGAVLFAMLTGAPPFIADTPLRTAMLHVNAPLPNIREHREDLPEAIQAILARAMAKQREERFATATLVAEALETIVNRPIRPTTPANLIKATHVELGAIPSGEADMETKQSLYTAAVVAMDNEAWATAIQKLNELLALDPTYRDTVARLSRANRNHRAAETLKLAKAAYAKHSWEEAASLAAQITASDSYYDEAQALQLQAMARLELETTVEYENGRPIYKQEAEAKVSGPENAILLEAAPKPDELTRTGQPTSKRHPLRSVSLAAIALLVLAVTFGVFLRQSRPNGTIPPATTQSPGNSTRGTLVGEMVSAVQTTATVSATSRATLISPRKSRHDLRRQDTLFLEDKHEQKASILSTGVQA